MMTMTIAERETDEVQASPKTDALPAVKAKRTKVSLTKQEPVTEEPVADEAPSVVPEAHKSFAEELFEDEVVTTSTVAIPYRTLDEIKEELGCTHLGSNQICEHDEPAADILADDEGARLEEERKLQAVMQEEAQRLAEEKHLTQIARLKNQTRDEEKRRLWSVSSVCSFVLAVALFVTFLMLGDL